MTWLWPSLPRPTESGAWPAKIRVTHLLVTVNAEGPDERTGMPRMGQVMSVRAIEYHLLPRDLAGGLGLSPADVKVYFGDLKDLAVVKCVDRYGQKLTAVGNPEDLRDMLASTGEGRSDDLELARSRWPVLFRGWLQAS